MIIHIAYVGVCSVIQWCLSLCYPMDYSLPGTSVHGIFQARILDWVAISFSRGSSWPRDWTCNSCITLLLFFMNPCIVLESLFATVQLSINYSWHRNWNLFFIPEFSISDTIPDGMKDIKMNVREFLLSRNGQLTTEVNTFIQITIK